MVYKLSFQEAQTSSEALGEFAKARSAVQPDKDLILTVAKISGSETLKTIRVSEMAWLEWIVYKVGISYSRVIYWLGYSDSSLSGVARFLTDHEPFIPKFSGLQDRKYLALFYCNDNDLDELATQDKQTLKRLRDQKIKGCEIFKRCLVHHNQRHYCQVHVLFQEYEKEKLVGHGSITQGGITGSWPNPMGPFRKGDVDSLREKYKLPIIDQDEFLYLDPFFRKPDGVLPRVAGFCFEYGLGAKKNTDEAEKLYRVAANQNEYSACYNLGRLLYEKGEFDEAIDYLKKGEGLLVDKIDNAQQVLQQAPLAQETRTYATAWIKTWTKALNQIYLVLVEAYRQNGNIQQADEIEQKIV